MSKRLQVVLDDAELRELRRAARRNGVTLSRWVRDALRAARQSLPSGDRGRKLALVRAAARHRYPTADIDAMLAEIERGYGNGTPA